MADKKVGELIKEARNAAGLSQEKLAAAIEGLSASEVGKAERGEKMLTQDQLKAIAKATGVTQKSLLEAAKAEAAEDKTAKATSSKSSSAKKTQSTSAKKTSSSEAKTSGSTGSSIKVSAAEKKLVELYRKADADTRKQVMNLLKGTEPDAAELITNLLGNALEQFMKK